MPESLHPEQRFLYPLAALGWRIARRGQGVIPTTVAYWPPIGPDGAAP